MSATGQMRFGGDDFAEMPSRLAEVSARLRASTKRSDAVDNDRRPPMLTAADVHLPELTEEVLERLAHRTEG